MMLITKIRELLLGSSEFDNFDVSYRVALGNYYQKPIFIQSVKTVEGTKWIISMQSWLLNSEGCWHPKKLPKQNPNNIFHFNSKEEALSALTNSLQGLKHTLYQDKPSAILCLIAY